MQITDGEKGGGGLSRLKKKCSSQKGASLLIALLFFLLCLTVGTVVLTAAGANAGRLADLRQEEQACLTVSSAARMLRDKLDGAQAETVTAWVDGVLTPGKGSPWTAAAGIQKETLEADAGIIYDYTKPNESGSPDTRSLTIEAPGMEPVSAEWVMGEDYSLRITLWTGPEQDSRMTLVVPAAEDISTANSYRTKSEQVGVDETTGQPIYNTYTITTTRETHTVTWGTGTIQKGAGT